MHTGDIYPDHALTTTAFTDEVIKRL
jgi:hypothetical protein